MVLAPSRPPTDPGAAVREAAADPLAAALRPAWVDVDLDALERNLRRLTARVRPAQVLAVLKADAYGHGAPRVARLLAEAGVDWAGVALLEEGAELRRAGVELPILVLGTAQPSQLALFRRYRLTPTVSSRDQLALWREYTAGDPSGMGGGPPQPVHLKVDTGMGRLGVALGELPAALAELRATPGLLLTGFVSHLAASEDLVSGATGRQEARFGEALDLLTAEERGRVVVHLANSAAALHRPTTRHQLVRLGLALYGLDPAGRDGGTVPSADGEALEPVMSITSRIVQLQTVEPGTSIGYGGRWTAARPSRIAVVPVGYADGYAWRLGASGGGAGAAGPPTAPEVGALVGGRRVPLAGAVSMDMLTLDVTDVTIVESGSGEGGRVGAPLSPLEGGRGDGGVRGCRVGDDVTLLGRQGEERITARDLARAAGTIPYELLCLLGLRLPRRYFRHGRPEGLSSRFSEATP